MMRPRKLSLRSNARASGKTQTELKRFNLADSIVVLEKAVAALTKKPKLQRGFLKILNPWADELGSVSLTDSSISSEDSFANLASISTVVTSETFAVDEPTTIIDVTVELPTSVTDEPTCPVAATPRRYSWVEWLMVLGVIFGAVHVVTSKQPSITTHPKDLATATKPVAAPLVPAAPSIVSELWTIWVDIAKTTKSP